MKNIVIILALLVLLLASCDFKDKNKLCLEPVLDIHFSTKMAFTPGDAGSFIDSNDSKEYFYFCNKPTDHRIDIFDAKGSFVKAVDIQEVANKFREVLFVTIVSMDTILFSSFYTNELIAINSNSEIWFYLNIDSILPKEIQGKHEFIAPPQTSFSCNREALYYRVYPRFKNVVAIDSINMNCIDDYNLAFYNYFYNSPYFFKLSNYFSDTLSFEFGLNDIYHQICVANSNFGEGPTYTYINDKLIFYSMFSNSLFIINSDNFKIEKEIGLSSKFTKIGHPAVVLTKGKVIEQMGESEKIMEKSGKILRVFYDNSYYYIVLKHEDLKSENPKESKTASSFSVIVLNNDFVFVDEFLFDAKEYDQYSGMMTQKGLAFKKTNTQNEKIYTVFNLF
ncbi:MAG: hypothetical protein PHW82_17420 [Bacteroidales bacterium]|nr:hypothetical protein [Bacteroidales bacterium]